MPSPSTAKQVLSLPFRTGLSQKQDQRWLEPGYLVTAQNARQNKTNVVGKRQGYSKLTRAAQPANVFTGAVSLLAGRRLATVGDDLLAIATDAWTDAAWTYDEASAQWMFVDRVPEAYGMPDRTVMAFDDTIREMDTVICNGYALHTCLVTNVGQAPGTYATAIWYKVENAQTGEAVLQPRVVDPLSAGPLQCAAKVIALGTNVVLGYMSGDPLSGTMTLNFYVVDMTQPWLGWVGPTQIANLTQPGGVMLMGAWDMAPTATANTFLVVYETGVVTAAQLELAKCTVAAGPPHVVTVASSSSMNSGDAGFVSDGQPLIRAWGIDVTGSLATVAYAYVYIAGGAGGFTETLRVKVQQWNWSTVTSTGSAVDLMTSPGPLNATSLANANGMPHTIQVAPIAAIVGVSGNAYRVGWSPMNAEWDSINPVPGVPGQATAFTALWSVIPSVGHMIILANSPRLTWGVAMASRWLANVNGIGYCLARIPSWEQGTYFLFADDAWQDTQSYNNGSAPVSYFPMRCVATFAPRLSSWIYQPSLEPGVSYRQTDFQDQYLPHSVPHICANPGADGTSVYQALISVSSTAQSQCPTLVQWDMDSPLSYSNAVLGTQTFIATGTPSLSDGARVHEAAFPYYPSILSVTGSSGGSLAAGTYSYIAIYDWVDAKGQLHRSARSAGQSVEFPLPGNTATIVVTTMGFSAKEKAPTAVSATKSPQSNGALVTLVTVRLFRTQTNGELYYEVGAMQNQQGQPTVTFTDTLSDTTIGTNLLLYNTGLDSEMQGAILDALCPPAFQCVCVHQNRIFGVDGTNIWATKELVDGEGPAFNELMAFSWDEGPGPITAIASFGDKLVVWKRDAIGVVTGQGPQDDGGQNDWSPVLALATDVGCIDWRSVVVKGDGAYFDSAAGRREIGFDLVVKPVPSVEDVLLAFPVTTSATLHPTAGRILTTSNADDTTVPRVGGIVDRDYVLDSWMTDVQPDDGGTNGAVSAVVANAPVGGALEPTYHWMDASGVVWRESPASWLDAGATYVATTLETAWIKAAGIEDFARFRRLQVVWQNLDPHQLSVYVAFDYGSTYYLMGTVTAAMMTAMSTPLCQQLFALPRQRAEAVRFKLVDAADAVTAPVTGQGPLLVSMGLEVARYTNSRTNRLPAAQRT